MKFLPDNMTNGNVRGRASARMEGRGRRAGGCSGPLGPGDRLGDLRDRGPGPPAARQRPRIVDWRLDAHAGREELVLVAEVSLRVFGSLTRS